MSSSRPLGVRRTFLAPAQTLGAAHWAMGVLGLSLPYAEVWRDEVTEDPGLLRVRLEARVRRFRPLAVESVRASLVPATVHAGTPIRVLVSAQRDLFVGVFAWQGDGTVSRVAPKDGRAFVEMKTGQAIHLPEEGETQIVGRVPPALRRVSGLWSSWSALCPWTSANSARERLIAGSSTVSRSRTRRRSPLSFFPSSCARPESERFHLSHYTVR